ncbi:TonB-dependent receptor [Colwellia sp. KU-HH00111]|uniref:TonB-dependent receptor n=1 Tax=Colwellia sp. KU-HH00111 TaxID=3127652 RepID=UPI0031023628
MKYSQFKISALTTALLAALTAPYAIAEGDGQQLQSMEKITILGEKTERSLKDTSSSVSVITEETLKTMQSLTMSNAISDIPNVVVLSGATPDIRGVSGNGGASGFNAFSGGAKARVSTLIDGVVEPFVAFVTADSGIWDVEQVEVFRGPQSTSNGRNSIGGAVYVKTKDPSFDWEGAARLGYRNQDSYIDSSFVLSGPIVEDELAFRASYQRLDGDTIDNPVIYDSNPSDHDLNAITTNRLKTKLLWQPKANEDFSAMLMYSTNDEKGNAGRKYYAGNDPYAYQPINPVYMDTESETISIKLDYVINESISIDFLAAVMDYDWAMNAYAETEAGEQRVIMEESNTTIDAKINFGNSSSVVDGFVGLAYFEREQDFNSSGSTVYNGDDSSDSNALYGEISYTFSDVWSIIAGGRIERETQHRDFDMPSNNINHALLDKSKTIALPKLVLQYQFSDDTTLSLSGRRGYNAAGGALNWATQAYYYYDEETVDTYEFTARSNITKDINFTANAFYNNFNGYQALSSTRAIVNMDKAQTYGAEFDISAMITEDFQLNAGLGLLKTEITDAGENYADATGNELNSAPEITAKIGGKYWLTDELNIGLSVNYVGEYFGDFANTEERVAGGYTLTRLNVNYTTDNWLITAFVNNALSEQEFVSNEPVGRSYPNGYSAIVDQRNIGASVTYSF